MKRRLLLAFASVALFLTGCPSFTTVHTATPVAKGTAEVRGAAGVWGLTAGANFGGSNVASGGGVVPYGAEIHGRYGISENLGIGGKLTTLGMIGADVNVAPINTSNFALSINPAVSMIPAGAVYGTAEVNVLADVVKTENTTFTVGAKPGGFYGSVFGQSAFSPYIGGTAGVKFWVNNRVAIMPWVDAIYSLDTGPDVDLFMYTVMLGINARVGGMPGGGGGGDDSSSSGDDG